MGDGKGKRKERTRNSSTLNLGNKTLFVSMYGALTVVSKNGLLTAGVRQTSFPSHTQC